MSEDLFGADSDSDGPQPVHDHKPNLARRGALHDAAEAGDIDTIKTILNIEEDEGSSGISREDSTAPSNDNVGEDDKSVDLEAESDGSEGDEGEDAGDSDSDFMNVSVVKVDKRDWDDMTPIHLAILNGHVDCVRILFSAGANPDIKCEVRAT